MKKAAIILLLITIAYNCFAQDTVTHGNITVWIEQGWIIKAKNSQPMPVTFRFSWTTTGTNQEDEVVSEITEESQNITLNGNELRHLFTAPQDPNKEVKYTFSNIIITDYIFKTKEDWAEEKRKAKIQSGQ